MSEREMTLQEWVERLPEIHAARREYDAHAAESAALREENRKLSGEAYAANELERARDSAWVECDALRTRCEFLLGMLDLREGRLVEAEALLREARALWGNAAKCAMGLDDLDAAIAAFLAPDSAGTKRAYHETHEPPHCPTCDCAPDSASGCDHSDPEPWKLADGRAGWKCRDCGAEFRLTADQPASSGEVQR